MLIQGFKKVADDPHSKKKRRTELRKAMTRSRGDRVKKTCEMKKGIHLLSVEYQKNGKSSAA